MCRSSRSRSNSRPARQRSDVACPRSGAGKSSSRWLTLTPTPTTHHGSRAGPAAVSAALVSTSTPHSFRPPTTTSLGHFTSTGSVQRRPWPSSFSAAPGVLSASAASAASRTAAAARKAKSGAWPKATGGRKITENVNAVPGGANHRRPCRPRPAVCRSATMTVPSGAPSRARRFASSLVEPVSSRRMMRCPKTPPPPTCGAASSLRRAGPVAQAALRRPRLRARNFHFRVVQQPAHGRSRLAHPHRHLIDLEGRQQRGRDPLGQRFQQVVRLTRDYVLYKVVHVDVIERVGQLVALPRPAQIGVQVHVHLEALPQLPLGVKRAVISVEDHVGQANPVGHAMLPPCGGET